VANWDVEQHIHSARQAGWPDRIHAVLKRHNVKQVGYVADGGIARLIDLCERDNAIAEVALSSEAEGAGLVLGATLGGERAALMMQSSGVGNCINTFSILKNCAVPCVLIVSMRGEFADFNPWQVPMGSITEPVLELCGFHCYRVDHEDDAEPVTDAACRLAFGGGNMQVAVLLGQRMVDRTKPKGH
jgi:sulfopyruvate decarboxylase TPP-binding subunit